MLEEESVLLCANSSAMLPVHTFAYYHQVSGKSYYLFLQRDTIRGGLAVKKKTLNHGIYQTGIALRSSQMHVGKFHKKILL